MVREIDKLGIKEVDILSYSNWCRSRWYYKLYRKMATSKKLYKLWGFVVYIINKVLWKLKPHLSDRSWVLRAWNKIVLWVTTRFDFPMLRKSCENKFTCSIWHRPMPKADDTYVKVLTGWTVGKDSPNVLRIQNPILFDNYLKRTGKTMADKEADEIAKLKDDQPDTDTYDYLDDANMSCIKCGSQGAKSVRRNKVSREKEFRCSNCYYVFSETMYNEYLGLQPKPVELLGGITTVDNNNP